MKISFSACANNDCNDAEEEEEDDLGGTNIKQRQNKIMKDSPSNSVGFSIMVNHLPRGLVSGPVVWCHPPYFRLDHLPEQYLPGLQVDGLHCALQ